MPDTERIFISWSGEDSKRIATGLREVIKIASDNLKPFVSDIDIDSGTRGLEVIAGELAESRIAILIVDPENIDRPWLNFEAGSIAAKIDDPINRVIPLLINMTPGDIPVGSPLRQFQARRATLEEITRVFKDLADMMGLEEAVVLDRCSEKLRLFIEGIEKQYKDPRKKKAIQRSDKDMLEEITLEIRSLSRSLPELLSDAFDRSSAFAPGSPISSASQIERFVMHLGESFGLQLHVSRLTPRTYRVMAISREIDKSLEDARLATERGVRRLEVLLQDLGRVVDVSFDFDFRRMRAAPREQTVRTHSVEEPET